MNEELKNRILGEIHVAEVKKSCFINAKNGYVLSGDYPAERFIAGMIIEIDEHVTFLKNLLKDE